MKIESQTRMVLSERLNQRNNSNVKSSEITTSTHKQKKELEINTADEVKVTGEDCNTCDALGIPDKKDQMFKLISQTGPSETEIKDMKFWEPMPEPPDYIELGNSGWTLLHAIAAYYPTIPTNTKKEQVRQFLESFSKVYPCDVCAKDFQHILKSTPPQLDSQHDFSMWLCNAHNNVNIQLGKPTFDCNLVNKRWQRQNHH
ncbi:hypothetical protein DLAC_07746 [Tieghemostelium lacteum]|uniref:Sulfhydryl oxidase n=1 Tax=Tieghemostelium lacteum TaxID=361077 RepID=A0A151ZAA5_TIELA|nr:hypothetical protein DLAC_07746 [Tieghemostelium lacteum]|eukprot:KYQ90875.1 hypothetical protein DLAC_07746 [Tieghemostelium lacteum]